MIRLGICALFALAYLTWVAVYLLPSPRAEVLSEANLRRVFSAAITY